MRISEKQSVQSNSDMENAELVEALRQARSERDEAHQAIDELQQAMEEARRPLAKLDALKAGIQLLRAATASLKTDKESLTRELKRRAADEESLRMELERRAADEESLRTELERREQLQADTDAILRSELHNLWNSWSWRLFRPLRNLARRLQGFGRETEPILCSESQVIQTIVTIRQSLSWELTVPLRLIYRILPHRRRGTPSARSMS